MFRLESQWIYSQSVKHASDAKSLIDIGSDGKHYRKDIQPYISKMYERFRKRGIKITTLDADSRAQPDIIKDICAPSIYTDRYDLVLASNVLEHLSPVGLNQAIQNLFKLAGEDGLVVVTIPYNLPPHERPIDNLLRPAPEGLKLLIGQNCLACEQWQDEHYREPYISDPYLAPLPIVTGGVFRQA